MTRLSYLLGSGAAALLVIALGACSAEARRATTGPVGEAAGEPGSASYPLSDAEIAERKKHLTKEQFRVTQESGTEAPFTNAYVNNHDPGIFVDVVSGEPLFSSKEKFDSGTGWPSFWAPLDKDNVVLKSEGGMFGRTEVRSRRADSHLGHVFGDGPAPTGQRFCMNSASLRFIPAEKLAAEGYGQYASLFPDVKQVGEPRAAEPASAAKAGSPGVALSAAATEAAARNRKGVAPELEVAVLSGGCFWGMQELLRKLDGVVRTDVGYSGGTVDNPSYERVSMGDSGHAESVRVVFDPKRVSYEKLLLYFFKIHDPTTPNRQHNDVGSQYRSGIFFQSPDQEHVAFSVKSRVDHSGKMGGHVVTEITPTGVFYRAEEYHQDYLQKHPGGYNCHFLRNIEL